MPDDALVKELLGFNLLFVGETEEGKRLLNEINGYVPDYSTSCSTIPDDFPRLPSTEAPEQSNFSRSPHQDRGPALWPALR